MKPGSFNVLSGLALILFFFFLLFISLRFNMTENGNGKWMVQDVYFLKNRLYHLELQPVQPVNEASVSIGRKEVAVQSNERMNPYILFIVQNSAWIYTLIMVFFPLRSILKTMIGLSNKTRLLEDYYRNMENGIRENPSDLSKNIAGILDEQIKIAANSGFEYLSTGLDFLKKNRIVNASDFYATSTDIIYPEFFEAVPHLKWRINSLVIWGILGTLIGFTLFVLPLQVINFSDANNFVDIIQKSLGGLSTAFTASILGVVLLFVLFQLRQVLTRQGIHEVQVESVEGERRLVERTGFTANSILGSHIALGSWIGDPKVKLKSAIAARAHV